uniref:NADH-ubiquinone oxidoreductase chain 6 n=2 Tax=Folsomia candida TaxID=158441 RepID=A0A1S5QMH3_FOLCA|nr:NADH dehydrogenase subunit 6 [Folsomia candida]
MFLLTSASISAMFYLSSHPVMMMVLIISQTMILCITVWFFMKTSWFSYILFLIFLGGLMVLFIYITSLASNELISLKMITLPNSIFIPMILVFFMIMNVDFQEFKESGTSFLMTKTFNFLYSWNNCILLTTSMLYLFLTLVIVVKISNKFEAPLKTLSHFLK